MGNSVENGHGRRGCDKYCNERTFQTCGCLGTGGVSFENEEFNLKQEVCIPQGKVDTNALRYLSTNEQNLMNACSVGNIAIIRYYIQEGAPVNTYDEDRTSTLHIACRSATFPLIEELINLGAQLNIADAGGWTPLHIASSEGRGHVCYMLLSKGANPYHYNRAGKTPLDLAPNILTKHAFKVYLSHRDRRNKTDIKCTRRLIKNTSINKWSKIQFIYDLEREEKKRKHRDRSNLPKKHSFYKIFKRLGKDKDSKSEEEDGDIYKEGESQRSKIGKRELLLDNMVTAQPLRTPSFQQTPNNRGQRRYEYGSVCSPTRHNIQFYLYDNISSDDSQEEQFSDSGENEGDPEDKKEYGEVQKLNISRPDTIVNETWIKQDVLSLSITPTHNKLSTTMTADISALDKGEEFINGSKENKFQKISPNISIMNKRLNKVIRRNIQPAKIASRRPIRAKSPNNVDSIQSMDQNTQPLSVSRDTIKVIGAKNIGKGRYNLKNTKSYGQLCKWSGLLRDTRMRKTRMEHLRCMSNIKCTKDHPSKERECKENVGESVDKITIIPILQVSNSNIHQFKLGNSSPTAPNIHYLNNCSSLSASPVRLKLPWNNYNYKELTVNKQRLRETSPIRLRQNRDKVKIIVEEGNENMETLNIVGAQKIYMLDMGIKLFNVKYKMGISFLIAAGVLQNSLTHLVHFMFKSNGLYKYAIGDILSDINYEHQQSLLDIYISKLPLKGISLLEALTTLFSHVYIPHNIQILNVISKAFAKYYFIFNSGRYNIKTENALHHLVFSTLLLDYERYKQNIITKHQFINLIYGLNDGNNFTKQFIYEIYDTWSKQPILVYESMEAEGKVIDRLKTSIFRKKLPIIMIKHGNRAYNGELLCEQGIIYIFKGEKAVNWPIGFLSSDEEFSFQINVKKNIVSLGKNGKVFKYAKFVMPERERVKTKYIKELTFEIPKIADFHQIMNNLQLKIPNQQILDYQARNSCLMLAQHINYY